MSKLERMSIDVGGPGVVRRGFTVGPEASRVRRAGNSRRPRSMRESARAAHCFRALALLAVLVGVLPLAAGRDRDHDGLDDELEIALGTRPDDPDSDGDGLLDGWEVLGIFAEEEPDAGDGEFVGPALAVEPLPSFGCNPLVKDVLVELDWMIEADGGELGPARDAFLAAVDVQRFFERSGEPIRVSFDLGDSERARALLRQDEDLEITALLAEGADGDRLLRTFRVRPDERKSVPYQSVLPLRPECRDLGGVRSLHDLYHDRTIFRSSRRNVFYYVLLAHGGRESDFLGRSATGVVSNFSDDSARRAGLAPTGVQVGAIFREPALSLSGSRRRFYFAASLLHELGHAFGLGHGGARADGSWDPANRKPNYPSVMNHRFQLWGVSRDPETGEPQLGFSRGDWRAIDERAIDEKFGLGVEPTAHVLGLLRASQAFDPLWPWNIDWNQNGVRDAAPYGLDLNDDGRVGPDVLVDHDDWGRLLRDGFDGIGRHAFRTGGPGCASDCDLRRVPGEFTGDGRDDLLVFHGARGALLVGDATSGLRGSEELVFGPEDARLPFSAGQQLAIVDLDGDGVDELLVHHFDGTFVASFLDGVPRLVWSGGRAEPASEDDDGWDFRATDSCRVLGERGEPREVVISREGRASLLRLRGDTLTSRALWRDDAMGPCAIGTGGSPTVQKGRWIGMGESLLVSTGTALCELRWRGEVAEADRRLESERLDEDGVLPAAGADVAAWTLSPADCFLPADLDGDGTQEIVVRSESALAVLAERDGRLVVVFHVDGTLDGIRLSGLDPPRTARLKDADVDELILFGGDRLLVVGWLNGALSVRVSIEDEVESDELRSAVLPRDARLLVGRFGDDSSERILLVSDERAMFLRVDESRIVLERVHAPTLAGWSPGATDLIEPLQLDRDSPRALFFARDRSFAVIGTGSNESLLLAGRIDLETLAIRRETLFLRGDSNRDGEVDLSDAIFTLQYLFLGRAGAGCLDALDTNDDGDIDLSDGIRVLNYLFAAGPAPAAPGAVRPGVDPTDDTLGCDDL